MLSSPLYDRCGVEYDVDAATGCWNWLKGKNDLGYPWGHAHRKYFEIANGVELTSETHVHHKCRNTSCVNPQHLEGLPRREHFQLHYLHEKTGLDFEDVREVRRLGTVPGVRAGVVAYSYGLSETTVYKWWSSTYGPWQEEVPRDARPLPMRTCARPKCGAPFQQRNRQAKYCSKHCQERAWADRNRARLNREAREAHARKKAA